MDSLRPDFLGVYDPQGRQPPVINKLAQGAAIFTEAVCHAPFTTPAIASLLTGVYPFRTGVRLLLGQLCNQKIPTLAEYTRRAGFLTAGFPSTLVLNSPTGLNRGFDLYRDIHDGTMTCRGGCWQT
ncbi:MAG: sulfatase-like hydrolase/transferase [Phycisphaerae bacterium]|nr:sulfatase-like hydrolase/transferase [Phycisphaerae bacterium]